MRILTVCTANICRSPLAAALLSQDLTGALGAPLEILSRGTRAEDGYPACPVSFDAAGLPLPNHESVRLSREDIANADLILTAEAAHRAAVVTLHPAARSRVFTLTEAAALTTWLSERGSTAEGQPSFPTHSTPEERFSWWVSELNASRGAPADRMLDIDDPHGGDRRVDHRALSLAVVQATTTIARGLNAAIAGPVD